MLDRRQFLVGGAMLPMGLAVAAAFPSGTVKLIYNFAPGGPGDAVARYLAEQMSARFGQQVVVDNRTGASGTIGILAAARAPADGYTLLFTSLPGVVQLPYTSAEKDFDPVKGLDPIAMVGTSPLVILANPSVPVNNFPGFVEWARAQKDPVQIGGAGAIVELGVARLNQEAKLPLQYIPYRGSAPAVQAVLSGEVMFYFMPPSAMTAEHVKAGKLKVIGVTSAGPSALVPGGAPISQQLPGFVQEIPFCLWAPPGTPAEPKNRIGQVVKEVLARPDAAERLLTFGMELRHGGPRDVTAAITREADNVRRILATTPIKFGQ